MTPNNRKLNLEIGEKKAIWSMHKQNALVLTRMKCDPYSLFFSASCLWVMQKTASSMFSSYTKAVP